MSAALLLARLDGVRKTGSGKWSARCPAHEDRTPSLAITETDDGTVLVHDFAGCTALDIMSAVGLGLRDLFRARLDHYVKPRRPLLPTATELLALIEFDLAVIECVFADVLVGVKFTDEAQATASGALTSIRRVLGVCHERC